MSALLSIAIPTKNRYKYLINLLETVHGFQATNFEVVVHDNTDNNREIIAFLARLDDNRIKYFHYPDHLDMVQNSDMAISHCNGEYICFLGDDDGIVPELLDWASEMKKRQVKAMSCSIAKYEWPDVQHQLFGERFAGRLSVKYSRKGIREIDTRKELWRVVQNGGVKMYNLPRLYHGLVHREVLAKMHRDHGTYFPGPSPDMANSVALCKYLDRFLHIDLPLVVSGHGAKSAGGKGVAKKHVGSIKDQKFLPESTLKEWDERIPTTWTGQTIWAQTCLLVLRKNGEEQLMKAFNFSALYARLLIFHPGMKAQVKPLIRDYGSWLKIIPAYLNTWLDRGNSFLNNLAKLYLGSSLSHYSVKHSDMREVSGFLSSKVSETRTK